MECTLYHNWKCSLCVTTKKLYSRLYLFLLFGNDKMKFAEAEKWLPDLQLLTVKKSQFIILPSRLFTFFFEEICDPLLPCCACHRMNVAPLAIISSDPVGPIGVVLHPTDSDPLHIAFPPPPPPPTFHV